MDFFDFDLAADQDSNQDAYRPVIASCDAELNSCLQPEPCFDSFDLLPLDFDLFQTTEIDPGKVTECEMTDYADFESMIPGYCVPAEPCTNCAIKQLECFVIYKGRKACTSCITLFKDCSFDLERDDVPVKLQDRGGIRGLTTLHGVDEDAAVASGSTTGKKLLRSTQHMSDDVLEKRGRKTGTRFSRESIRVMKDWLNEHAHHPYPTDEEKDHLKQQTGLKRSQIANWLANARRRGKIATQQRSRSPAMVPQCSSPGIAIPSPITAQQFKNMNPLERWQHSPPENEPASVTDIASAVASSAQKNRSPYSGSLPEQRDSSAGSSFSVFRAPSMTSIETGKSSQSGSDMSFSSLFSHNSHRSFGSASKDRRRRRRQPLSKTVGIKETPRPFQCTFCVDTFKTKHDWSRHEKSLHLSLERWTCAPLGGIIPIVNPSNGLEQMQCVYCHCINPDASHLEVHNYSQCNEKPLVDRSFYRKDHLSQHLRLTHACTFLPSMASWKTSPSEIRSRCGFCDAVFNTWEARVDHLAKHFRSGKTMSDWKGDWGFDRPVLTMLENAMPPWLIPNERDGFNPLSAEKIVTEAPCAFGLECEGGDGVIGNARHCYQRLEKGLTKYLKGQLAQALVPSDKDLQQAARIAVYGYDDDWNQTAADNVEWLARFKKIYGFDDPSTIFQKATFSDDLTYCSLALEESRLEDAKL